MLKKKIASKRKEKKQKGTGSESSGTAELKVDNDDEEDWSVDTSKEAVEARRRETLGIHERLSAGSTATPVEEEAESAEKPTGEVTPPKVEQQQQPVSESGAPEEEFKLELKPGQNPILLFQDFWKKEPTPQNTLTSVKALQNELKWSDMQLIKTVFGSLFDKNIRKDFYEKVETLQLFVPTIKEQKIVLLCIEKLCEIEPTILEFLSSVLNGFYEEEVLSEELLLKWYEHPNKKMDAKLSKRIRDAGKPFIDWLQTAETEDSDDNF